VNFLQLAHAADERYTVRDGINIARYALKLLKAPKGKSHLQLVSQKDRQRNIVDALRRAVQLTISEEALMYLGEM
jgi:hypothetical protein